MQEDELKNLLGGIKAPTPDPKARAAAIAAAREVFVEKKQGDANFFQGSAEQDRLQGEAGKNAAIAAKEMKMQKRVDLRKSLTALAVVGVVGSVSWMALSTYKQPDGFAEKAISSPMASADLASPVQTAQIVPPPAPSLPEAEKKAEIDTTVVAQAETPAIAEMRAEEAPQSAGSAIPAPTAAPTAVASSGAAMNMLGVAESGRLKDGKAAPGVVSSRAQAMIAPAPLGLAADSSSGYYQDQGRDKFEHVADNVVKQVSQEPVSTFSTDVDTASYTFMRRSINEGHIPQPDVVRVEEMVNYFDYNYPLPESREQPFQPSVTVAPAPWNTNHLLVHVGIKGFDLPKGTRPKANLVFLIDVSGSMNEPTKLPLAKTALKMLVDTLKPDDKVSIVTYAGNAGTALEPTTVSEKNKILQAIDSLGAGGGTAGAAGIQQAYALAETAFVKDGVNRVMLATDGDFNIGVTDQDALKNMIVQERGKGIYLSVFGFGMGNYNDATMQVLAQNGNGNAAYIDNLNEAQRVLVDEANSTLFPIAKDVKFQIEFNPKLIAEYRLIGYETRMLAREDFNNDKIDAGDIGAGHAVTAIYEVATQDSASKMVDDLRYAAKAKEEAKMDSKGGSELAYLKIRYKLPNEDTSKLIERPITAADQVQDITKANDDTRFATAVAAFGQMLRGGKYTGNYGYDDIIKLAEGAKSNDAFGQRGEFVNLVRLAKTLQGTNTQPVPVRTEE